LTTALPADRVSTLYLDTDALNATELGAIKIASTGSILVNSALEVAAAGDITLFAPKIEVNANLTAHSGSLQLGNVQTQITPAGKVDVTLGGRGSLTVNNGVSLDASGLWSNQRLGTGDGSRLPYLNGGSVALRSSGDMTLTAGSQVDVSSGAALDAKGQLTGGKGGDLTLAANANSGDSRGSLALDGELLGYGVNGGGRLSVQAGQVLISDSAVAPGTGTLQLGSGFFNKGFGAYDITGNEGLVVADGTQLAVTTPVYRLNDNAQSVASGAAPRTALEIWTPPQYQENPTKGLLTPRKGASVSLQAGTLLSTAAQMASAQLRIGQARGLRLIRVKRSVYAASAS